jgi:hypothetical protein
MPKIFIRGPDGALARERRMGKYVPRRGCDSKDEA